LIQMKLATENHRVLKRKVNERLLVNVCN